MPQNNRILVDGKALRRLRLEADLTQEALAEKSLISVARIKQLEQMKDGPESSMLNTVRALCSALGCDPSAVELVKEEVA